nr:unnamed protein product [Callosobruchus chinensis]
MSAPLIDEDVATTILKYPKKMGDPWQPKNLQTRWKCIQCDKFYCMICFTESHLCTKYYINLFVVAELLKLYILF